MTSKLTASKLTTPAAAAAPLSTTSAPNLEPSILAGNGPGNSPATVTAPTAAKTPTFHWRVWPIADHWLNRWLPIGVAAVAFLIATAAGAPFLAALLASTLVAGSMWRNFFPVDYEIGPAGIRITRFGRSGLIAWNSIGRCEFLREGALLLLDQQISGFDRLRGPYLRWNQHGETVRRLLAYYLQAGETADQPSAHTRTVVAKR